MRLSFEDWYQLDFGVSFRSFHREPATDGDEAIARGKCERRHMETGGYNGSRASAPNQA